MKEFYLTIKVETAAQLKRALEEAVSEVVSNEKRIDRMTVDASWDITAGDAEEITLGRAS